MIKEIRTRRSIRKYVGYADETPKARPRKKLEEIVHYENW